MSAVNPCILITYRFLADTRKLLLWQIFLSYSLSTCSSVNSVLPQVSHRPESKCVQVSFFLPVSRAFPRYLEFPVQYPQAPQTFAASWAEHPGLCMAFARQRGLLVSVCTLQQTTITSWDFPLFPSADVLTEYLSSEWQSSLKLGELNLSKA